MAFTTMPESITGLTNLLILLSAGCCLAGLRGRRGAGLALWRGFYFLLALSAVLGVVVHCLDWGLGAENLLWLGVDLLVGAMLALLPLAALTQVRRGRPPLVYALPCLLLGAIAAWVMIQNLLSVGFRSQFGVAAIAGVMSLCLYAACVLILLLRDRERQQYAALAGLALLLLSALPWAIGSFEFRLGPIIANQAALLHLGLAGAAPLFYAAIEKEGVGDHD